MKKILFLLIAVLILLCGCSYLTDIGDIGESEVDDVSKDIQVYTLPASLITYTGADIVELADGYIEMGDDYCSYAKVVGEELELGLTDVQRDNLVKRNNDYIETLWADFEAQNDLYSYIPDSSYQKLVYYFDEKLDVAKQMEVVYNVVAYYGLNYILTNNDTDWNVDLTINNCHTNKQVAHVILPHGVGSYGPEEWAESYNE